MFAELVVCFFFLASLTCYAKFCRTSEMFVQLKTMFGSVASVPAKVFLTG